MNGFGIGEIANPSRVGTSHSANGAAHQAVCVGPSVRRLTPLECERLMGFPDGYTAIPLEKRNRAAEHADMQAYYRRILPHYSEDELLRIGADGPRYKALGNSWAVPVVKWIGERIQAVENIA